MEDSNKTKDELLKEVGRLRQELLIRQKADVTPGRQAPVDNHSLLQAIISTTVDGIITINEQGIVETFNPASEKIFGYTAKDVIGKNVSMLMPSPYKEEHDEYVSNYLRTGEKKIIGVGREVEGKRKDGTTFPLYLGVSDFFVKDQRRFTGIVRDLTKEKKAEQSFTETQRRLETLIGNLPGIAYRCKNDRNWTMEFISSGTQSLVGYPASAFTDGRRSFVDLIHSGDQERVWEIIQSALKKAKPYTVEYRLITAEREERWVWEQGCGVFGKDGKIGGLEGFITDITEKKKLEERDIRLWRIFEESLNEIYIFDASTLRFIEVNQGARKNLGYSLNELKKLTPFDLKPEFTKESFEALIQPLRSGEKEKIDFTTHHLRKDGSRYPIEVHLQLTSFESNPAFVAIILNITERMKASEELHKTQENLTVQTLFTQRLSALAAMAGGIAHELNQPLNNITLYSETIKNYIRHYRKTETGQISDALQKIIEQAQRASRVIEHMREFASEKKNLSVEKIEVRSIVHRVLEMIGTQLKNNGIEVVVEIIENIQLSANQNRLEQVLINLLTNAKDSIIDKDYTSSEPKRITITAESGTGSVVMRIRDTGRGIDENLKGRIFEPFVTTKGPDRGTGLGLAICHGILKDYGATITLEKSGSDGTTFKLEFPEIS